MDPLQNSSATLRGYLARKGCTPNQLSKSLGYALNSVKDWVDGKRQAQYGHVMSLAEFFHEDLITLETLLLGEKTGDPCPCGCGGKKIRPTNLRARHLDIRIHCLRCGAAVERRDKQRMQNHRVTRCEKCTRIPARCEGYRPFPNDDRRVARGHQENLPLRRSKFFEEKSSAIDSNIHLCRACAGALTLMRLLKRDVEDHLRRAREQLGTEKFEELTGFSAVSRIQTWMKICLCGIGLRCEYRYIDADGNAKRFRGRESRELGNGGSSLPKDLDQDGNPLLPKEVIKRKPKAVFRMTSRSIGQLVRCAKEERANHILPPCPLCGKVLFVLQEFVIWKKDGMPTATKIRAHGKCLQPKPGERGFSSIPNAGPGADYDVKVSRRRYCWAILHRVAQWEFDRIAVHFKVPEDTVKYGNQGIYESTAGQQIRF